MCCLGVLRRISYFKRSVMRRQKYPCYLADFEVQPCMGEAIGVPRYSTPFDRSG